MSGFFRYFFGRKQKDYEKPNRSINPLAADGNLHMDGSVSKLMYKVASCQSPGKERLHNEDTLFTFTSFRVGVDSPVTFGIYLVADGMGGHQSGELASHLASKGASQFLMRNLIDPVLFEPKMISADEIKEMLIDAVKHAQRLIMQHVPGGGTTLTLALLMNDEIFSAHVGDSRLYLLGRNGKMTVQTKDHSLVRRLVELGEITEEEALNHHQRNVLYRALGQSDPFEPDIDYFTLGKGEKFMICSDGLWGVLEDQQALAIINNANDLDTAVCQLVEVANDAGGPDNISVILVERLG